jgi:hypothetical protein
MKQTPSRKRKQPAVCRDCGCTNETPCLTEAGPCYWVKPSLCSACATPRVEVFSEAMASAVIRAMRTRRFLND